jgi:hypothetical protein
MTTPYTRTPFDGGGGGDSGNPYTREPSFEERAAPYRAGEEPELRLHLPEFRAPRHILELGLSPLYELDVVAPASRLTRLVDRFLPRWFSFVRRALPLRYEHRQFVGRLSEIKFDPGPRDGKYLMTAEFLGEEREDGTRLGAVVPLRSAVWGSERVETDDQSGLPPGWSLADAEKLEPLSCILSPVEDGTCEPTDPVGRASEDEEEATLEASPSED